MTPHVVSKGLANPKFYRESVSGWQATVLTKNGPASRAGCYSPLHAGKVSDPAGHVKHNRHSLSLMTPSRDLSISLVLT
jgi:hypothetical protein